MKEKPNWIFLLVAILVLVAILYTYPLVFNLSTRFPGFVQTDTCLSIWNIWHLKTAIFSGHNFLSFTTDYIFYPQKPSLVLHNYTITTGLMSLPIQLFFSPIVSMNLIFFIQFVLTGMGMYLLAQYYTKNKFAALWSAVALAFCPYVLIQSCYFIHFSTIWVFPWFVYFIWRFRDRGKLEFGCLAALVYALSLLEDQTYFFFLTILAVFMAVYHILGKRGPRKKWYARNSFFALLVFFIIALPYILKVLVAITGAQTSFLVWPDQAIDYFSLHPGNLLRPSPFLAIYKGFPGLTTPLMHVTNVFAGYAPLFFALFALLGLRSYSRGRRRIIIFWLATGAIFFLISLGPWAFGKSQFLSKFSPYNYLCSGVLRQLRIPVRFSLITLVAIYILAAFGIERFMKLNRGKLLNNTYLGFFLVMLVIVEFLPVEYPLLNLKVPKVYFDLASQDKGSPVLVLPLGWQTSYKTLGGYYKEIQFYQTVHQHPIFQGQIARIEEKYLDYYLSQPGFKCLMSAEIRVPAPGDKEAVFTLLRKYGIKHVVIHPQYFDQKHLEGLAELFKGYPGELSVDYAG